MSTARRRAGKRGVTASEDLSDDDASAILGHAVRGARAEGRRLLERHRVWTAAGGLVVLAVAVRAIAALGSASPPADALALGAALALGGALCIAGLRTRARAERKAREVQALKGAAAPTVEIHPQPVAEGVVRPVVVVRTDDMEALLRGDEPTSSIAFSTHLPAAAAVLFAGLVLVTLGERRIDATHHRWTFVEEAGTPDALGFRLGPPRAGGWALEDDRAATGARSLVNRSGEGDAPAATLVASSVKARDLRGMTRCRVGGGRAAGACGLVFRWADDATHHVAHVDVARGRVVVARVSAGVSQELGSAEVRVAPGVWYELVVEARGDTIKVSCNGRTVVELRDTAPSPAGNVGLWAPAATEAFFDELSVDLS